MKAQLMILKKAKTQSSLVSEYFEQLEENIDDVKVQDHCRHDIVIDADLVALAAHDQLGVEQEIEAEEHHTKEGKEYAKFIREQKEQGADEYKCKTKHKQDGSAHSEVTLSSASVDSDTNGHTESADSSSGHSLAIIICGDEAYHC